MARFITPISSLKFRQLSKDGLYALGGVPGLCLRIKNRAASYVVRYTFNDKRRQFAFGRRDSMSLSQARLKALEIRALLDRGIDPHDLPANALQQDLPTRLQLSRTGLTFREVAERWHKDSESNGLWSNNARGAATCWNMLELHALPLLGKIPIAVITPEHIRDVLSKNWTTKSVTACKTATYIKKIFAWAIAMRLLDSAVNPADMKGPLGVLMQPLKKNQQAKGNFAALDFHEVPDFCRALYDYDGAGARLALFSILTAARSKAVRLATWDEFDLEAGTWEIPAEHDKIKAAGRSREIYLSKEAVGFLKTQKARHPDSTLIFPNGKGKPLTDMAATVAIRRLHESKLAQDGIGWIDAAHLKATGERSIVTIHGTARSSFKTWTKDDTLGNNRLFDQEAVELCLLHARKDAYNGAYDRSTLETERRKIMAAWGAFCWSKIGTP